MINFGAVPVGAVLPIFFDSFAGSTGASITLTGLAATDIEVYKGTSMTQRSSDAGFTLLDTDGIDLDGVTGIHGFSIDTGDNTDASFYAAGSFYTVVVSAVTIDSQTVNFVAATFRLVPAEGVAGQPKVDVGSFGGTAGTFSGGRPEVNTTHAAGTAWGSGAITAASIASDAITAAKIAADAIDLATFAADAKALFGVIAFGTAQSVTGTTIQLASAETFADDELIGATVIIRSATTGAGQARVITDYVSATDTATVDTWTTTPTGTITYIVIATPPASTSAPIAANVTQFGGVAGTFSGGRPEVNATHFAGTAYATAAAAEVDAIWDEVLTAAAHNVASSAGRRLRQLGAASITGGTAQAGASNSITLAAAASATNEIYDSNIVVIVGGTGAGQTRVIVEYNGTSKVATVDQVWVTNPDNTSEYEILADHQADISHHGLAQAGAATSITLASTASATDDVYKDSVVYLSTSTGSGQARLITAYNGTTKVATVSPAWATNPGANTVYKIIPFGRVVTEALATQAKADVNAEVVDALNVDTYAEPGQGAPAATTSLAAKINYLYKNWRNRKTQTSTTWSLYADDATTVDQKSTVADDATTASRTEIASGP